MRRLCEQCGEVYDSGFRLCGACLDLEEALAACTEYEAEAPHDEAAL